MVEELSDPDTGRELALADVLAYVPGYRQSESSVQISELCGGSVNRSYSVLTPAGRYVVRVSRAPDAWLAADTSVERKLHGIAAAAGIAPAIVHASDRWLITHYVPGRLWAEPDFARPDCLARLGDTLRRLHQLPATDHGRFDLLKVLNDYAARLGPRERASLAEYLDSAARAWRLCGAGTRPLAILHHDLHASNLIDAGEDLVLIDWECAVVSDPLLDVACVLAYYESARPYASLLLRHAGLGTVTPQQLAASMWLFDLHTYLWYRERRLRLSPTEAELEAERLLSVRLPYSLKDWRLGP
jgi:aminoglycoside phosphotransferase (APT) family kinase protein